MGYKTKKPKGLKVLLYNDRFYNALYPTNMYKYMDHPDYYTRIDWYQRNIGSHQNYTAQENREKIKKIWDYYDTVNTYGPPHEYPLQTRHGLKDFADIVYDTNHDYRRYAEIKYSTNMNDYMHDQNELLWASNPELPVWPRRNKRRR